MSINQTYGYVIVNKVTGANFGGAYNSTGGAKNSFNRATSWNGHTWVRRSFDQEPDWEMKRLVSDEGLSEAKDLLKNILDNHAPWNLDLIHQIEEFLGELG